MRQDAPRTEIDPATADSIFGNIETVIIPTKRGSQSELGHGDQQSIDDVFGHSETITIPTERVRQIDVSQHHERAGRHDIQTQAESMMKKTVTTLKALFGFGEPSRRPRTSRSLGGIQNLETRMLMSGTPAEIRMIDTNGAYVLQQETLTEAKKIDFSTLAHGVYPEKWTTTIEGLGQVTMWFQGGTRVDSKGISAVQQPLVGTGFWFRFDNAPAKVLSAELEKEAATQGFVRIVKDNDYVRENGSIKNFDFAPTLDFQGALIDRIDGGQNGGRVNLKSITVGNTVTRQVQEIITETKKIDFSTMKPGVYPEKWTTTIEGLGQVTMWFQGGTRVDSKGISAVQQPLGGTGFWIKFDAGPVKVLTAELQKDAATQGFLRVQANGDYVREGGRIKDFALSNSVDIGAREISLLDAGQQGGTMSIKSITVATAKTQNVKDYIEPTVTDTNANGTADELALAQQEGLEEVLAPVGVTMETIGDQGVRGIRITAPFDETYLDTGRWGVIKTVHQGGANDLRIFNNYLTDIMDNPYGSQTKVWKLYADKEMQVPISEITFVGNRGGFSHFSAIAQPVKKNMLPEGIETEPVPKLHIAHLSGPNVLFQVSSPIAQSTIEFAGVHADSILGTATVMKSAEGVMNSASITMNPANPSGDYNVFMKGPDGRVFERVLLHWDRDTKKLTLGAGEALWTAPESLQPSVDAAVVGMTQSLTDMTTNDPSLKAIQQEILLTAASSMPGMQHDFNAAFWAAHPEWKDDAINAKALADSQTSKFSYGQIRQGLINQRNDTLGVLRESYGKFEGMLGDLLKQASQILSQIRNGANETELRRLFAITVDRAATSLPMYQLASIGIRMPTSTQILVAAKCAGESASGQLMALKNAETKVVQRQETELVMLGSGKYVRDPSGVLVAAVQQVVERSDAELLSVHQHNLSVILTSEGVGKSADRIRAYAKANNLSEGFVMKMTGVTMVGQVIDTKGASIVLAGNNFEWIGNGYNSLNTPNSKNTLIAIVYGSNEYPGDKVSGFDNLALNLGRDYDHVMTFSPGRNPFAEGEDQFLSEPAIALQLIKNRVEKMLIDNPEITNIVFNGYSWGGSTVNELAMWISNHPTLKSRVSIAATVYVDAISSPAVTSGDWTTFTAENRLPMGTKAMLNIFQSRTGLFSDGKIHGGPIGIPNVADFIEIDLDKDSNQHTHTSIDDVSIEMIRNFILKRILPKSPQSNVLI